ncbi:hypothetical protein AB1K91_17695 [Terribacillus sp. 179-K 1B1 HS]|uniref:hypothetical protein n=1 Tax=Terribacillus sp. 179-K 1B1 HS TaxID=3142388 RepID=UPI0039A20A39
MIVDLRVDYQERFRLYLTDLGKRDGDEVILYEYLQWNSQLSSEFKKQIGKSWTDTLNPYEQEELSEFLKRKVIKE